MKNEIDKLAEGAAPSMWFQVKASGFRARCGAATVPARARRTLAPNLLSRRLQRAGSSFLNQSGATVVALLALLAFGSDGLGQSASTSLSGRVVEDLIGNGITSDDTPVSGRTIRLFRDNGDQVFNPATDTLVKTDTTRRDGSYAFRNLAAGTYFVQQDLPNRWVQSLPQPDVPDPTVTPAQCGPTPKERNDTMQTAVLTGLIPGTPGTYLARGEIGDNNYQSLDVDMFAVQLTAGSLLQADLDAVTFGSPLDSVLRIFDATGRPLAGDDDALGGGVDSHLDFYAPATGTYYVGVSGNVNVFYDPFVEGSGMFGNYTGEYTIEIKVEPQPRAMPLVVTLAAGEQRSDANLASSRFGSITGTVYVDVNGNGRRDPGEPGMNSLAIAPWHEGTLFGLMPSQSIDLNGDGVIDPATETGLYAFEGLFPGSYEINNPFFFGFGPAGWMQFTPSLDRAASPCLGEVSSGLPTDPGVTGLIPDLTVDLAHGLCDWFVVGNLLHFGQATPNIGLGPMDLIGGPDLGNGSQIVFQRIYQNTALTTYIDVPAGTFTYHPEHGHIHFDDYARYSLRQALPDSNSDGIPEVGAVVAGGQKTSFCLVDVAPYDLTLPNAAPQASGFGCGIQQRISVGWEDIYEPYTPGQQIDITGLAPGQYWLEAVVDPDNHLREANENNNVGRALVSVGPTAPNSRAGAYGVAVVSGQTAGQRDFGLFQLINIGGQVFEDQNRDGQQNNKEHGLNGWIVYLDLNGDGVLNNPEGNGVATALATEPWTTTDNQGNYLFADRGPGAYPVRVVPRPGWILTTLNPAPIAARSGQNVPGVLFGFSSVP